MSKPLVKHAHPEMRWMIRTDMPQVLRLDELNNEYYCWSEKDYLLALRQKKTIGMVCEMEEKIVGVVVYDLEEENIFLQKFEFTTPEIAELMIDEMKYKMRKRKSKYIEIVWPDDSVFLSQHKFWSKMGWKASLKKNFFASEHADAYSFTLNNDNSPLKDKIFKTDNDV